MVEMMRNGLSYRWSSMGPRERRVFTQAMIAFAVAGFIVGFLAGVTEDRQIDTAVLVPLSLLPMVPLAVAVVLLRRFGRFLDEFQWKIDHKACHIGVRLFIAVATPLALMDGLAKVQLMPGWGYVLLLYAALVAGCVIATRQLTGPDGEG